MSITERLARYVVETSYEQIPSHIVDTAKHAILDCLGTTLAGSREECGKIAADLAREEMSAPVAAVLGAGFKTSPSFAALANGTAGHALDYDDGSVNIHGHASVAILPAALALSEGRDVTGRDLLTAYVVAYEVGQRIGLGINPRHYDLGWHTTSTMGSLRAVAGAARILRLDVPATRRAFGLAATMACGLIQNFGTMTKPLHAGLAARNGIVAAQLAAKGLTVNESILEAERGFCHVFCNGEGYDLELMGRNLGNPYCLEDPGIVFKPYPCCRASHPAIDGILYLRRMHQIDPADVERVRVGLNYIRVREMRYNNPRTVNEARFSTQFDIAVALIDGRAGLRQFSEERLHDPAVRSLMERVEQYVHPSMEKVLLQGSDVEITLRDGRVLHHWVEMPLGSPANPMPKKMAHEKFRECAEGTISAESTERAIELIENLPDLRNLDELTAVLNG